MRPPTLPPSELRCWRDVGVHIISQCRNRPVSDLGLCRKHLEEMRGWGQERESA